MLQRGQEASDPWWRCSKAKKPLAEPFGGVGFFLDGSQLRRCYWVSSGQDFVQSIPFQDKKSQGEKKGTFPFGGLERSVFSPSSCSPPTHSRHWHRGNFSICASTKSKAKNKASTVNNGQSWTSFERQVQFRRCLLCSPTPRLADYAQEGKKALTVSIVYCQGLKFPKVRVCQ